jgi:hypothetical protein
MLSDRLEAVSKAADVRRLQLTGYITGLVLVLAAMASTANAAVSVPFPRLRPAVQPMVIFFGGYKSTAADMRAWLAAARASTPYGKMFAFTAIPYPADTSFVEAAGKEAAKATIAATAAAIAKEPSRTFIVVGHSSGGGLAAAVVESVPNGRNVRMVILDDGVDDGFTPPPNFDPAKQVECWSTVNSRLESFNHDDTKDFCSNYHELRAESCRTAYCLHFAILNRTPAPDLSQATAFTLNKTGVSGGYQNLRINLGWLDSSIGR